MRRLLTAAALAVLFATSLTTTANAQTTQAIEWFPCEGTTGAECAYLPMPIDWKDPSGPAFKLAIGRLKATDPAKRIGVLIAHPGGPGNSGIDAYMINRRIPDDSPLRKYFDIVTVDPRGVSRSAQVRCSTSLVEQTPRTFPANQVEYDNLLEFNHKLAQDCRRNTGPLFDHVDTISAVRDVDGIRAALGERQISFYGASYGTQVGQQYAELFPARIRAMTLDSNMDHSITSAFDYLKTTTVDQEASYLEFAAWCKRTEACKLHGQDPVAVWDRLHAKAEAGKLVDPETGEQIDAEALRLEMFLQMFRPKDHWFPLAARLAALDDTAAGTRPARVAEETVAYPYYAIWCSDWRWQVSGFAELDRQRRAVEALAPHTKLSPFWSDVTGCLGWSGPFNNPQHKLEVSGAPTILLTASRWDVGTPRAWSDAASDQIDNSVLLEYAGIGHGNFRISGCARQHIENYLIHFVLPMPGPPCPAEYPVKPGALASDVARAAH